MPTTISSTHSADFDALLHLARLVRDSGYAFTTVTPATHERVNKRPENEWAKNLEGVFGWSRPFQPEILPPAIWDAMQKAEVVIPHGDLWRSSVRLSCLEGQLFMHSAYPTVEADAVFFGPDTYRFGFAIKKLFALGFPKVERIVDIGCGAGPGAILCALAQPQAQVLAVDINERALLFTRVNAALAEVSNVEARHSDLLSDVDGEFNLIVANPPYLVDPSERAYRHGGGALGAGLSLAIVDAALERLAPGGTLLLYTGAAVVEGLDLFRATVEERLRFAHMDWSYREVDPDVFGEELLNPAYSNADRIAAIVLKTTKRKA